MVKQQFAPETNLDVFDGNPLNFHYFMAVLRKTVEKIIEDPRGRLTRIIHNKWSEELDLTKNYIQIPAKDGYKEAKNQFYKLHDDPHRINAAYSKEIDDGHKSGVGILRATEDPWFFVEIWNLHTDVNFECFRHSRKNVNAAIKAPW